MIKSGPGGICLLCGGIDGLCRSGFENDRPQFECFHANKKLSIDMKWKDIPNYYDVLGYLINEAPDGTILTDNTAELCPNCITIDEILSKIPASTVDKLDGFLKHLYKTTREAFGTQCFTDVPPHIAYCMTTDDVECRVKALEMLGYLIVDEEYGSELTKREMYGRLTPVGVFRAEELLSSNKNSKKVFIAMEFKTKYSEIIRSAVKKGCAELSLIAETVDEINYVGDITDRIISDINKSKFVIADYTMNNSGVYYESGYARGKGIVVIETCNKKWFEDKDNKGNKINKLHFDVEHRNMILWENENDLSVRIRDRIESLN